MTWARAVSRRIHAPAAISHRNVSARVVVGLLLLACGAKFSFAQEFEPRELGARAARHADTGEAEARAERHARAGHGHRHHHTNTTTAITTNTTPTPTTTTPTAPTTTTPTTSTTTTTTPPTTTHKPPPPSGGDPMWTGLGGNVNWSTAGNWTPGAPTSSATTDLIFAGTTNTGTLSTPLNQNIATPMLLRSITFDATAGNFFLGGGQIGNSGGNTLTITQSSSNSQNIANAITNTSTTSNGTMTLALAGSGTGVVTLSGIISNSTHPPQVTALTTTAGTTSTFVLSGTNSYTGATNVNGGTLLVNGSTASGSAVTVNNSGTVLGGTGTINGTVNVNANAIINPGPKGTAGTAASVGTLTTGALTLVSTAIFHGDASGTLASNWDKLVVNGLATLRSSTLQLIIASGLTFTPGTTYTLIDANTISGTFNGIADNSLQTFSGYEFIAHYNLAGDGNFELTAVPEPSTWVAGGLAFAMLLYTQRSRLSRTIKRVT